MKYRALLVIHFFINTIHSKNFHTVDLSRISHPLATYQADWLVVGAGPAGISAVAALRDARISPEKIIWIDQSFNVGALGQHYKKVIANSTRKTFFNFFGLSKQFRRFAAYYNQLNKPHKKDCLLGEIVKPLDIISHKLRQEVASYTGIITNLTYDQENKYWVGHLPEIKLVAKKVILATGSHPKKLEHHSPGKQIPLEIALNKKLLRQALPSQQGIVVFGSSHSAALVLKNLIEIGCSNIVHIFKHNLRFREKTPAGEVFPFSGLKGPVATWAHKNLLTQPLATIKRIHCDEPTSKEILNTCTAIIDAVGFEANPIPVNPQELYPNPSPAQELGPHLYGVGIAFPEKIRDAYGNEESAIGLLSFMQTLKRNIPLWINN